MNIRSVSDRPRRAGKSVKVVLGPTNTGKTHFAIERMLGHVSGIIGLPLRLLAREVYDRMVRLKGAAHVALITGEEKIIPERPSYFVCTVEAMPMDRDVAFVAVDEIQLCADLQRGHVFTDRLLHARGRDETLFLGADTIRPLLKQFLPDAEFIRRPRFSRLTYMSVGKLTRLPRRSAIVAFTAPDVYAIAEMMRRQRGGAAVVMGNLSPRTRNAQVELYQNGDVDYLVATDAIGMGLNLDIEHVAFASLVKFDGFQRRMLTVAEIAQIAGRAGRHLTDGSFGLAGDAAADETSLTREMISSVEEHRFAPLQILQWRNSTLGFASVKDLIRSLEATPGRTGLTRALEASDLRALRAMIVRPETADLTSTAQMCRRLWDACQIPDFRKISPGDHAYLVSTVFGFLAQGNGNIPNDWMSRQLNPLDRVDGDIDSLAQRIAHVRTLTYIANRANWLQESEHWQALTRELEDRLSDALHDRLSQKFIDRRTSMLLRELRHKDRLMAVIESDGRISVEGHFIGHMEGLRFQPDEGAHSGDDKVIRNAAEKALGEEISSRARQLAAASDSEIHLHIPEDFAERPGILWQGHLIARLTKGPLALTPGFDILSAPVLQGDDKTLVENRLRVWLDTLLAEQLKPLFRLKQSLDLTEAVSGLARGIAFQIFENMGTLPRRRVARQFREVDKDGRRQLRQLGIWLGATSLYLPGLLKPQPARLRTILWSLYEGKTGLPILPQPGLVTLSISPDSSRTFYDMLGYRAIGDIAVRLDMLERLHLAARARSEKGPFLPDAELMSLVGCSGEGFEKIMSYLGYALTEVDASAISAPQSNQSQSDQSQSGQPQSDQPQSDQPHSGKAIPEPEVKDEAAPDTDEDTGAETLPAPAIDSNPVVEPPESAMPENVPEKIMAFIRRPHRKPDATRKFHRKSNNNQGTRQAKTAGNDGAAGRQAVSQKTGQTRTASGNGRKPSPRSAQRNHRSARADIFDKDSPFAALMELKKAMAKK